METSLRLLAHAFIRQNKTRVGRNMYRDSALNPELDLNKRRAKADAVDCSVVCIGSLAVPTDGSKHSCKAYVARPCMNPASTASTVNTSSLSKTRCHKQWQIALVLRGSLWANYG